MIKVVVRVRDKSQSNRLEKLGSIIFKSPVINMVILEMREENLTNLKQDRNVLSYELEPEGRIMYA